MVLWKNLNIVQRNVHDLVHTNYLFLFYSSHTCSLGIMAICKYLWFIWSEPISLKLEKYTGTSIGFFQCTVCMKSLSLAGTVCDLFKQNSTSTSSLQNQLLDLHRCVSILLETICYYFLTSIT